MVHSDGTSPRLVYSTPRASNVPAVVHFLHASGDGSQSIGHKSLAYYRERDVQDHEGQDFHGKSVLSKVKDKARRWRQNLGKKKDTEHEDGTGTGTGMPCGGIASLLEEEEEEDAEYLGAPMYESELAPLDCKEHARQHPRANPVISENHLLPNSPRLGDPRGMNSSMRPTRTMAPSRSLPNRDAASMMQGLTIRPRPGAASSDQADDRLVRQNRASPVGNAQRYGISMREYLAQKLKPGEDDKALSRVITNSMSPRAATNDNITHEVGIVEKVKDAVSSLLNTGDSSSASSNNAHPASRGTSVSNTATEVMEEESHGRILQTN
ncbi:hypothetical protein MLD38_017371 [Melastoma candidum]|uniref:Uncharacterized protein n=1 Tax=Melastoma candidum TaxID=119954 RepID=A0ACB9QQC1_9MYRT|nr:hypothetical protein MLD38_017371 [Melastoma candidum]